MTTVIDQARRFRSAARRRGTRARGVLATRYARIATGVRVDAERLERRVSVLRRQGQPLPVELVRQLTEAQTLRGNVGHRLAMAATTALDICGREVKREVKHAVRDAITLTAVRAPQPPGMSDLVSETQILNLVGLTDAGPLREVLLRRAGQDADRVADVVIEGVVRERPMAETAAEVAGLLTHGSHADALRIVRTETARARREAQRVVYGSTNGVVGWRWVCSLTPTSCGLCWANHGRVFPLSVPMASHPNCSCECAPVRLGEEEADELLGTELFDALTAAEQDQALGPATARAYRAGAVTLDDLVAFGRHPQWGPVGTQRSLVAVLGDGAREFYQV